MPPKDRTPRQRRTLDRHGQLALRGLRCHARSKRKGVQCGKMAIPGGTVCRWHGGNAPQVRRCAEERLANLIDKDRALRELARLAYADIGEFYDERGRLRPLSTWTPAMRATIASLKTTVYNRDGSDGRQEQALELKVWDKTRNLENLLRHLGLLTDKLQVGADAETLRLLDRLDQGRKRNAAGE